MKEKEKHKQKDCGKSLDIKSINKVVRININISIIGRIEIYFIYSK